MSDHEKSKKLTLAPAEAARLLRELADKLEGGRLKVGAEGAVPRGELKVKVSGKSKEGAASLAVKLQWTCAAAGGAAARSPSKKRMGTPRAAGRVPPYKSIKKRMNSTFKSIRAQLREGCLPDLELAGLFDEDAELMLHYPKKGEAGDIDAFRRISAAFAAAVKAGDLEAVRREAAALAAAEKNCHKRYK